MTAGNIDVTFHTNTTPIVAPSAAGIGITGGPTMDTTTTIDAEQMDRENTVIKVTWGATFRTDVRIADDWNEGVYEEYGSWEEEFDPGDKVETDEYDADYNAGLPNIIRDMSYDDGEEDDEGEVRLYYSTYDDVRSGPVVLEVRHNLTIERVALEKLLLHEIPGREDECECSVCSAGGNLARDVTVDISDMLLSTASMDDLWSFHFHGRVLEASGSNIMTKPDAIPPGLHVARLLDGVSATSYGPALSVTKLAGDTREITDAIILAARRAGFVAIAEDVNGATFGVPGMKLYKVTDEDGKAKNGGVFTYDLPKDGQPGDWTPAIPDPHMCARGYHLTVDPMAWYSAGARIFEVESFGTLGTMQGDKAVASSIRLVREAPLREIAPSLANAFEYADRVIMPAIDALIAAGTSSDPSDLPSWARLQTDTDTIMDFPTMEDDQTTTRRRLGTDIVDRGTIARYVVQRVDEKVDGHLSWSDAANLARLSESLTVANLRGVDDDRRRFEALWSEVVARGFVPVGTDGPFGSVLVTKACFVQ